MNMKDFQKRCASIVNEIDRKYGIKRDPHFGFTQLMEEVGELAKDINMPKLRNREIDQNNLNGEFADVILQLSALAEILGVDFEEAIESKIKTLKERHSV